MKRNVCVTHYFNYSACYPCGIAKTEQINPSTAAPGAIPAAVLFCARVELARAFLLSSSTPGRWTRRHSPTEPRNRGKGTGTRASPRDAPQSRPQRRTGASKAQSRKKHSPGKRIYSPTEPRNAARGTLPRPQPQKPPTAATGTHRGQPPPGYRAAGIQSRPERRRDATPH